VRCALTLGGALFSARPTPRLSRKEDAIHDTVAAMQNKDITLILAFRRAELYSFLVAILL
jgi:hypothetical protein